MIPDGHVVVGEVVGVFGIKGAMKVESKTDFPERFAKNARLFIGGEPIVIVEVMWHKGQARLRFDEIKTPEEAEKKRGSLLTVPMNEEPKLGKDEYMSRDLLGCSVTDARAGDIGIVDSVDRGVLYDILKVGETQIPAIKEFVKKVDLKNRRIEVSLIDGMIEEAREEE